MVDDLISLVSLESAGAKWLKIKTKSHNPGGDGNPFTSVLENKTSNV